MDTYTKEQLLAKISKDFDGQRLYYSFQNKDERNVNLVVWTGMDEKVYIYMFEKNEDAGYLIHTSMVSGSLKYEDVKGKEDETTK